MGKAPPRRTPSSRPLRLLAAIPLRDSRPEPCRQALDEYLARTRSRAEARPRLQRDRAYLRASRADVGTPGHSEKQRLPGQARAFGWAYLPMPPGVDAAADSEKAVQR